MPSPENSSKSKNPLIKKTLANQQLIEALALGLSGINPLVANAYHYASLFSSNKVKIEINTLRPIKIFLNNCLPLTGYLITASSRILAADHLKGNKYSNLNTVLGTALAKTATSAPFDFWQNYNVS